MTKKTFKWHLLTFFNIPTVNETGKAQTVHGSTYSIVVQPGESVHFDHDDAPAGY